MFETGCLRPRSCPESYEAINAGHVAGTLSVRTALPAHKSCHHRLEAAEEQATGHRGPFANLLEPSRSSRSFAIVLEYLDVLTWSTFGNIENIWNFADVRKERSRGSRTSARFTLTGLSQPGWGSDPGSLLICLPACLLLRPPGQPCPAACPACASLAYRCLLPAAARRTLVLLGQLRSMSSSLLAPTLPSPPASAPAPSSSLAALSSPSAARAPATEQLLNAKIKAAVEAAFADKVQEGVTQAVRAALSSLPALVPSVQVEPAQPLAAAPESLLDSLRTHLAGSTPKPKSKPKPKLSLAGLPPPSLASLVESNLGHSAADTKDSDEDGDDELGQPYFADSMDDRVAGAVLAQAQSYGSLLNWVRVAEWKNTRNKNECQALALAIDLLVEEGVKPTSLGLETLVRRLNGVHLADNTGNWGVCSALQWTGPNNSLLPRATLTNTLKQAAQMERLTRQTTRPASAQFEHSGRRPGPGHFDKQGKSQPFKIGATGPSGGARHQ